MAERLAGAYCFHGSRVVDPDKFRRRGLLPVTEILEEIWATLRALVHNEVTDKGWALFQKSVESDRRYRFKVESAMNIGPNGMLVREILLNPKAVSAVDYLNLGPEIVSDIAAFGADLELWQRYRDASTPCIVKFRSTQRLANAVNTALWYAYLKVRHGDVPSKSSGHTGEGHPVPPEDVVDVESVASAENSVSVPTRRGSE